MEIKVGDYIRRKFGHFGRVKEIKPNACGTDGYYISDSIMASGFKSMIYKVDKEIIKLVEIRRLCKW